MTNTSRQGRGTNAQGLLWVRLRQPWGGKQAKLIPRTFLRGICWAGIWTQAGGAFHYLLLPPKSQSCNTLVSGLKSYLDSFSLHWHGLNKRLMICQLKEDGHVTCVIKQTLSWRLGASLFFLFLIVFWVSSSSNCNQRRTEIKSVILFPLKLSNGSVGESQLIDDVMIFLTVWVINRCSVSFWITYGYAFPCCPVGNCNRASLSCPISI